MAVKLDISALRISRPAEVAGLLKPLASNDDSTNNIADTTTQMNEAVAKGELPAIVLMIWMGVARKTDASVLAAGMVQTHSVSVRNNALKTFCEDMRREHRFDQLWNALGGAEGIAKLLAQSSVAEVEYF